MLKAGLSVTDDHPWLCGKSRVLNTTANVGLSLYTVSSSQSAKLKRP